MELRLSTSMGVFNMQPGGDLSRVLVLSMILPAVKGFLIPSGAPSGASGAPPVVILPGFGNAKEDYINPFEGKFGEEASFEYALKKRGTSPKPEHACSTRKFRILNMLSAPGCAGHQVYVVDVKRTDWLKFATGIVTSDFWSSTVKPSNPSFQWYLDKVRVSGRSTPDLRVSRFPNSAVSPSMCRWWRLWRRRWTRRGGRWC